MATQTRIGLEAVLITKQFEKGLSLYVKGQTTIQKTTQQTTQSAKKSTTTLGDAFTSLGKKVLAFGATALGGQALIQFGVQSFQAAASAERLGTATENLGKRFGISGEAIVSSIQKASGFTISRLDAMRQANQAMLLGVADNEQQFARMTQIAVVLGRAMGQNATKSVEDLTLALGRQSPLILDNLGINLKLSEANDAMAQSLGKTVLQLTDAEKKQGFLNEALRKGEEAMNQIGGVTQDTAANIEEVTARWSDFQVAFGGFLTQAGESSGIFTIVTDGLEAWTFILGEAAPAIQEFNEAVVEQEKVLDTQAGAALSTAQNIEEMRAAVEDTTSSFEEIGIGVVEASGSFDEYNQNLDRLSNINADALGSFGSLIASIQLSRKEFTELKAALDKENAAQKKAAESALAFGIAQFKAGQAADFATREVEEESTALEGLSESLQQAILLGDEFLSTEDKIAVITARTSEQIAIQSARLQGLAASFGAAADFTRTTPQDLVKAEEEEAKKIQVGVDINADAIKDAIKDGLNDVKNAISSVTGLTFGENLPVEETFRVDEWVRRLQAVADDGKNEWVDAITQQFGGQEFFRPFEDAVASGDPSAISAAAGDLVTGDFLLELMDIDGAVEEVEGLLAEQDLQARLNAAVLAAMTGDGAELPAEGGIGGQTLLNAIGLGEGADLEAPITEAVTGLNIPTIISEALAADAEGAEGESPLLALLGLGEGGTFAAAIETLTGETLPAVGEAFGLFFTNAALGFENVVLATQEEDMLLLKMTATTVPGLQSAEVAMAGVFVTKMSEIDKAIAKTDEGIRKLADTIGSEIVDALEKAFKATESWVTALERAVSARSQLRPGGDGPGAGAGVGFRQGVGFQQGTLGFRVPAGFPNDTFPINVTSGERVVVSPPGRSIEQVTGLGSRTVEVNINGVTINNGMDLNMFEGRVTRSVTEGFAT